MRVINPKSRKLEKDENFQVSNFKQQNWMLQLNSYVKKKSEGKRDRDGERKREREQGKRRQRRKKTILILKIDLERKLDLIKSSSWAVERGSEKEERKKRTTTPTCSSCNIYVIPTFLLISFFLKERENIR